MSNRRAFGTLEAIIACALLLAPRFIATAAAGRGGHVPIWVVRLLGARMLLQGCWLAQRPTDTVLSAGTCIEAVHGTTMLCVAGVDPRDRSAALKAATLAAGLVMIGLGTR
jgi:hypothetical protein